MLGDRYDQGHLNSLQALDDVQLKTFLPKYISLLRHAYTQPMKVVDFGCGTGRNTRKVATMLPGAEIVGLDATKGLLEIAEQQFKHFLANTRPEERPKSVSFEVYNPSKEGSLTPQVARHAHGIICTLVLVHMGIPSFFKMCDEMLLPGGYLLISNTHSDLSQVSHANFIHPETGEQLWSEDHIHTIDDVKREGNKWGFDLLEVQEGIPEDPKMVGAMRGSWEGVKCWAGFILRKRE